MSRVSELRKAKNLTQSQFAAAVGADISTVRNWERDRDGVRMFVRVAKICKVLGCTPEDLFTVEEASSHDN